MGIPPPPLGKAMGECVLDEVDTYTTWIKNTVVQYIATWLIMELCEEAERRPGLRVSKQWSEQERINLSRVRASAAEDMEEADVAAGEGWTTDLGG